MGLEGLTIGRLADDLGLSKSGLFAHFQSKEGLQLAAMDFAAQRFVEDVIKPAFTAARGEPRVRSLFENWWTWIQQADRAGGCFFVAASAELDDRPGQVRDRLVKLQQDWLDTLAQSARIAITEGHFRKDAEPEQFAFEMYGILLVAHHGVRLMRDPKAEPRARRAFESLLQSVRKVQPYPTPKEKR
jgi:AcrR family transcriptional regulator